MLLALSLIVLGLAGLWLGGALVLDRHGRRAAPSGDFEAIIIPGCRVGADGSPSGHLARRVEKAVALWRRGWAPTVVTTGGGEPSEAVSAAGHAASLGLPATATVVERRSTTTEDNARLSAQLLQARRVLVVTDSYHVWRARRIFRRYFEEVEAVGVAAPGWSRLKNALREVLAIAWELVVRSPG